MFVLDPASTDEEPGDKKSSTKVKENEAKIVFLA